jgi:hypothetical protein
MAVVEDCARAALAFVSRDYQSLGGDAAKDDPLEGATVSRK